MVAGQDSSPRQGTLRRSQTLDESSSGIRRLGSRCMSGTFRRFASGAIISSIRGAGSAQCDSVIVLKEERERLATSDESRCSSVSITASSPMSSPKFPPPSTFPIRGRFGLRLPKNTKDERSRLSIAAAINAAGWNGLESGSSTTPSRTPSCTPPSPTEPSSVPRQVGFMKLAPWARSRVKGLLSTPKLTHDQKRSPCPWRNRTPRITPDSSPESEATCLPSASPASCTVSLAHPESPPRTPSQNPEDQVSCENLSTPDASPPRIARLSFDNLSISSFGDDSDQSECDEPSSVDGGDLVSMAGAEQDSEQGVDVTGDCTTRHSRTRDDSGNKEANGGAMYPADRPAEKLSVRGFRSVTAGRKTAARVRTPRPCSSQQRVRFLQPSPKSYLRREPGCVSHEVTRLRELVSADRQWPWSGRRIVNVQYVSMDGRHRWIRSEGCRNAILLVSGSMYLVELPVDALTGRCAGNDGNEDPDEAPPRGWYVKVDARALKSISVPMGPAEVHLWATEGRSCKLHESAQSSRDHGVIFHVRSGACAWVQCGNGIARDALIRAVARWHMSETKMSVLDIRHLPRAEVELNTRAIQGGSMRSLLRERKTCLYRAHIP